MDAAGARWLRSNGTAVQMTPSPGNLLAAPSV